MEKFNQENFNEQREGAEIDPETIKRTTGVLTDFLEIKPAEKVLLLTNADQEQPVFALLRKALEGNKNFSEYKVGKRTTKKEVDRLLSENQVIILPDFTQKGVEDLSDRVEETQARLLYMPISDIESFKEGGAMTEPREDIERHLNQMEARLRDAEEMRVTTTYGTDLKIKFLAGQRRWYKDRGVINRPGQWDNLPGGEIFTTPDDDNVDGVLVLPVLSEDVTRDQGVDEFVRLTIHHGKITSIEGGKSAEKLKKYWEKAMRGEKKEGKNSHNILQCAEIAFGANSKARSLAVAPDQSYKLPGVSVVEAEKRLGTMHIAFGDTKHGEEGAEGRTTAAEHLDFILPRHGLTVEAFKREGGVIRYDRGEKLINQGSWSFE